MILHLPNLLCQYEALLVKRGQMVPHRSDAQYFRVYLTVQCVWCNSGIQSLPSTKKALDWNSQMSGGFLAYTCKSDLTNFLRLPSQMYSIKRQLSSHNAHLLRLIIPLHLKREILLVYRQRAPLRADPTSSKYQNEGRVRCNSNTENHFLPLSQL